MANPFARCVFDVGLACWQQWDVLALKKSAHERRDAYLRRRFLVVTS